MFSGRSPLPFLSLMLLGLVLLAGDLHAGRRQVLQEDPSATPEVSREVIELITGTHLARDLPSPTESPEVIRRFLRKGRLADLSDEAYLALMRQTVERWPESRLAHEGLATALLGPHGGDVPLEARREAAEHLLRAAEISLQEGRVRYQGWLADLLAETGDAEAAELFFERAIGAAIDEGDRYMTHLAYAKVMSELRRPARAEEQFEQALRTRPEGIFEAYELYSVHLMKSRQYERVLELLTPNVVESAVILHDFLLGMRCKALTALGRDPKGEEDCLALPTQPLKPTLGAQPGSRPGVATRAHNNNADDCRYQSGCALHPNDPNQYRCFNYLTWNLAEIMKNEAGGEAPGSRASVAWTVRDRATRVSTSACGTFGGATGSCTSLCPWPSNPTACALQKKLCCVEHSAGQFANTHMSVTFEEVERARRVVDGELPDPVSGYIPQGASGCSLNNCDGTAYCNTAGSSFDYAPDGPVFFYGNSATNFRCQGYQPLVNTACAIVAGETCGNSTDGSGSDNCYLRVTRQRTWNVGDFTCGPGCTYNGIERAMSVGGYAYKTPTETPRFRTPGGKAFVITAAVASGSTAMRVRLVNSAGTTIHDFGTVTVSSTTYADFEVRSNIVVASSADSVRIINDGAGQLKVKKIIARD